MSEQLATVEERLYKTIVTVEERAAAEGGGKFFIGTGIVFNQPSRPLYDQKRGMFQEIIEPGAIDDDTDLSEVLAVFNHDENRLLGANYSGTLTFKTTEKGVEVRILKPENTVGNDCEVWVNRGDIRGMSFKFFVAKDRWETKDNVLYRYVEKISKLMDLSLVTRAAYLQTTINVAAATRSYTDAMDQQAATRGMYFREKRQLNENDQAFLTGLVAQMQTQVDFISTAVSKLTNSNLKRLAAGRLSDLIYQQSWIEETIAELTEATLETAGSETEEGRSKPETGETATEQTTTENPETRSTEPSEEIHSGDSQGHPLEWYIRKNNAHRNSL
ncbi:HK97 family phage prohead protease [Spirosoma endbachense]|uniref:HK97 family phage prohead protease n=1 Tax=Spirosoma endbachense TaxID=2666025 RepID=A0A6P1VV36_9BACT|nr:HK97 family phage prohead protease [Spirosoma endbachense]QHV96288.1 HK97 family phage prohead protease [Spirosoma endbachense]